jgi:hypothetical protein
MNYQYLLLRAEDFRESGYDVPDGIYLAVLPDDSEPHAYDEAWQAFRAARR